MEGERKGGRERWRERGMEGKRGGGREGWSERGREGERERGRERGREIQQAFLHTASDQKLEAVKAWERG